MVAPVGQGEERARGGALGDQVDRSRWVVVYPTYINARKTLAEGRRVPQARAVENPLLIELCDCLVYLRLPFHPEPEKAYSRDYTQRGRLRVQLKNDDGTPVNAQIPSRNVLLLKLATLVPKHEGRQRRQQEHKRQQEQQRQQQEKQQAAAAGASSGGPVPEKKGKSGKKKR